MWDPTPGSNSCFAAHLVAFLAVKEPVTGPDGVLCAQYTSLLRDFVVSAEHTCDQGMWHRRVRIIGCYGTKLKAWSRLRCWAGGGLRSPTARGAM